MNTSQTPDRETTQWISVKKRLPKNDDLVIVTNNSSPHKDDIWVCCGFYDRITKNWYNQFDQPKWEPEIIPTHWMPLPKPPQP